MERRKCQQLFALTRGSVYCFMCKLFCDCLSPFIELSFSDWRKAKQKTNGHDSSSQREQWLMFANKKQHLILWIFHV
jgi:hypothetical protein